MPTLTSTLACLFSVVFSGPAVQQAGGGNLNGFDASQRAIEGQVNQYLNGPEIKNVLTPGEFAPWVVQMKAGQVLIAEARSDAFDPGIQIVDEAGHELLKNDDRYPGDQRPLVLFRAPADGKYTLRVRCFNDKFGGQFFVRTRLYNCADLTSGKPVDVDTPEGGQLLLHFSMKASQVERIVHGGVPGGFSGFDTGVVISFLGLPDPDFSHGIRNVADCFEAPVAGDYYVFTRVENGGRPSRIRVQGVDWIAQPLAKAGDGQVAKGPVNTPGLWLLPVKKDDLLQVSATDLTPDQGLTLTEVQDVSKYDVSKPETNPFFPDLPIHPVADNSPFDILPARARDGRYTVIRARRDAQLWVATAAGRPGGGEFTLRVAPAAVPFTEGHALSGHLKTGFNDYWAFDAQAGDVLTLQTTSKEFTDVVVVRDPNLGALHDETAGVDQSDARWQMTVQKPGRYLLAMSCMGDGGAGAYSLSREVIHPRLFTLSSPAKAEIKPGEVQVWKFTVTPDKPVIIHWISSEFNYDIQVYDDQGRPSDFQHEPVDSHNRYGIINVSENRTFIVVLKGGASKANYEMALSPIKAP